jgi:hypothetical protein
MRRTLVDLTLSVVSVCHRYRKTIEDMARKQQELEKSKRAEDAARRRAEQAEAARAEAAIDEDEVRSLCLLSSFILFTFSVCSFLSLAFSFALVSFVSLHQYPVGTACSLVHPLTRMALPNSVDPPPPPAPRRRAWYTRRRRRKQRCSQLRNLLSSKRQQQQRLRRQQQRQHPLAAACRLEVILAVLRSATQRLLSLGFTVTLTCSLVRAQVRVALRVAGQRSTLSVAVGVAAAAAVVFRQRLRRRRRFRQTLLRHRCDDALRHSTPLHHHRQLPHPCKSLLAPPPTRPACCRLRRRQ